MQRIVYFMSDDKTRAPSPSLQSGIDNTTLRSAIAADVIELADMWIELPGGAGVVWMASTLRAACARVR